MNRMILILAVTAVISSEPSLSPPVFAQVGPLDADVVDAVFLEVDPSMTHRLGLRFRARMFFGTNVVSDFEVMRGARIFRDGQPARLFDLRAGDRIRFQLAAPGEPYVNRLVAFSR